MKKDNIKNSTQQLTEAQRQLVVDHMQFANHLGINFAGLGRSKGITVEELQADACFGLCEAALRFKADEGADFQTYAYDWCRKFIMLHIDDKDFTSDKDINDLDADIPEDDGEAEEERKKKVETMMRVLDKKEREVICLIYGFDSNPKGFKEIALLMCVHPARVHQIYENAMAKLEWSLSPALP